MLTWRPLKTVLILVLAGLLASCSTTATRAQNGDEGLIADPLEGFNRGVYAFNTDFDNKIMIPLARNYRDKVPNPVRRAIYNFFVNMSEPRSVLHNLLQGKFQYAADSLARFIVNSSIGLIGLIDVATESGLQRRPEDLGQTLAVWGFGHGAYLILPILGPSSLRDVWGVATYFVYEDPLGYLRDTTARVGLLLLDTVDTRSRLLHATNIFDQAAVDPYLFMRDSYVQSRRNLVYDGRPPRRRYDFE